MARAVDKEIHELRLPVAFDVKPGPLPGSPKEPVVPPQPTTHKDLTKRLRAGELTVEEAVAALNAGAFVSKDAETADAMRKLLRMREE